MLPNEKPENGVVEVVVDGGAVDLADPKLNPEARVPDELDSAGLAPKIEAPPDDEPDSAGFPPKIEVPPDGAADSAGLAPKIEVPPNGATESVGLAPKIEVPPDGATDSVGLPPKIEVAPDCALDSTGLAPKIEAPPDNVLPKTKPDGEAVGAVVVLLETPNLNSEAGVVAVENLNEPDPSVPNFEAAESFLTSFSCPGLNVEHAGHCITLASFRQRQPPHSHDPTLGLNLSKDPRSF